MTLDPYPYAARASWEGRVIAASASCLCLQRAGLPPVLYFPVADIDMTAFRSAIERQNEGDAVERWQLTGNPAIVLEVHTAPAPDLKLALGHGSFDTDLVQVEVIDGTPDTDERDISYKRFPTWGDASDLIDMLDLRQDNDLSFVSVAHTDGRRPVVEASQMLGQAIVAAMRHSPGRRVVSASMVFLGVADAGKPMTFTLDILRAGRTFDGLAVAVLQSGRCCGAGTILTGTITSDVVTHAVTPPDVAGPYESVPFDMGVTGRDLRVVDAAYTSDPDAPVGPPVIDAWVRFREVPDDSAIHAGLLAQFAGHMPIAAALRPHQGIGQSQAHRSISMGINAISLALHQDVRADEWMLYHHHSTSAAGGITHAECRVHALDGRLLASFTVEGMVRPFADSDRGPRRTNGTMSLTTGRGPLSSRPAGRFSVPMPSSVTYIEPFRRRVRATKDGQTVIDSEQVLLLHRPGQPPAYALPEGDVVGIVAEPDPHAQGYVTVPWDSVERWFEEDEEVFGHPRNPYHRVDCLRSQRRLVVEAAGEILVDTTHTLAVYETALDPRLYVARHHVRMDLLERSATVTYCPYKGTCSYWSARIGSDLVEDMAWSYEDPLPESTPLAGYLSFDDARAAVRHDLPTGS